MNRLTAALSYKPTTARCCVCGQRKPFPEMHAKNRTCKPCHTIATKLWRYHQRRAA